MESVIETHSRSLELIRNTKTKMSDCRSLFPHFSNYAKELFPDYFAVSLPPGKKFSANRR